ncbi:MAG: bifunctional phosphopantothenoylcysteine decarboxylase/phosphopantothenate--cysteine ligase CoaBC [Spirochaetia bacterium]|nr:bifunctional phosphopantothenoylcysteine decarboxylase/phosphopantothenate--cysteine ligase CoaBC [Spirochaetia bacterium]
MQGDQSHSNQPFFTYPEQAVAPPNGAASPLGKHPSKDILGSISSALGGKKVALGITGSVAAVRSSEVARMLMRYGVEVFPVMSPEATRIIHPNLMEWATGNPVITSLSGSIEHVALAGNVENRVDAVLIAPSTANTLGKIAAGIDDTPVTTLATTAIGQGIPMLIVPAMHEPMYYHPAVKRNIEVLKSDGIHVLMPNVSEGKAKIPETEEIVFRTIDLLRGDGPLAGSNWVVTAGRTVEYLDPIRVLTNNSSGKMGIEIVRALYLAGAGVQLVYGKGNAEPVPNVPTHYVETAAQMLDTVKKLLQDQKTDCLVAAAAVGDWQSSDRAADKISTHGTDKLKVELVPTPKIIDQVKEISPHTFLVAFRALFQKTKEEMASDGLARMKKAKADMIAVNDVGAKGSGFETATNELHLFDSAGGRTHIKLSTKFQAAEQLIKVVAAQLGRV